MTFMRARDRSAKLAAGNKTFPLIGGLAGIGALSLSVSVVAIMAAGTGRAASCDSGLGTAGGDDVICEVPNDMGDALFFTGDDTVTLNGGGNGKGNVYLHEGNDILNMTLDTNINNIFGGSGDDTINLSSGQANNVYGDGGNDTVALDGNDTITLNGGSISNSIDGGSGNDVILLLSGSAFDVIGDSGNDTITLNGASISNDIEGEGGDDLIFLLLGTVGDDAAGGEGNDTITLNGATVVDKIMGDNGFVGDDLILLYSGSVGTIWGEGGDDTITLSGASVNSAILGQSGNDVIDLISGTVGTNVEGGTGSDVITIHKDFDFVSVGGNFDGGSGFVGVDGYDTLNVRETGTVNAGRLLNFETINFENATVTLTGDTLETSDEDGFGVFLTNGHLDLDDGLDITGDATIGDPASRLTAATGDGTGVYTISGDLVNNGTIDLSGADKLGAGNTAAGDELSVDGDYTSHSKLLMDANLDATFEGDTLVVDGDILGDPTEITITDTAPLENSAWSGFGAGKGILIVDNSEGMDVEEGDFVLDTSVLSQANGEILKAPFVYTLETYPGQGEVRLQSDVLGQVYGYAILAEVMREDFPTAQERIGARKFSELSAGQVPPNTATTGIWARIEGGRRDVEAGNTSSNPYDGGEWSQDRGQIEIGMDFPMTANPGSVIMGVSGHVIRSTADAGSGRSSAEADVTATGYGGALTAAWFARSGYYWDLQGRASWWDADVDFDPRGISESTTGLSWGLSAESGQRFDMGNSMAVTPRVQVVYTDVDFKDFTDDDGVEASSKDGDSLQTTLGVMVEKVLPARGTWLYGDLSATHDFLGDSSIDASGLEFKSGLGDTWGELKVGAGFAIAGGASAYLQGEIGSAIDGNMGDNMSYGAKVGIRLDF